MNKNNKEQMNNILNGEDTPKKVEEEKSGGFEKFESKDEPQLSVKEKLNSDPPIGSLSVLDFVNFIGRTSDEIVKSLDVPVDDVGWGKFWFNSSKSSVSKSLTAGNFTPIIDKVSELKSNTGGSNFAKNIRKFDIEAMELYMGINLPLDFRNLKKEKVILSDKTYRYLGVDIWISPTSIFRSEFQGQKIVGGVKLYLKSTKSWSSLQLKIASYLMFLYIKHKIAKEDEIVLPQFCLTIDVFNEVYRACPSESERPISDVKKIHAELVSAFNRM